MKGPRGLLPTVLTYSVLVRIDVGITLGPDGGNAKFLDRSGLFPLLPHNCLRGENGEIRALGAHYPHARLAFKWRDPTLNQIDCFAGC